MIIGVSGYGATGSSAIIDLLREYNNPQILHDVEFKFTYMVDGLQDLEFHLVKQFSRIASGDYAIKRFIETTNFIKVPGIHKVLDKKTFLKIRDEYINSLIQCSWWGMESRDYENGRKLHSMYLLGMKKKILPFLFENRRRTNWKHKPCRKLYCSVKPELFYDKSKKFIRDILLARSFYLSKNIYINQAFEGNDPINSFPFYDNPKAIVVDRDPRDVYLLTKIYGSMGESRWCPRDNVEDFITYYRAAHMKTHEDTKDILRMNFEDLIYDYDNTLNKIEKFCGLEHTEHVDKEKFFKPLVSLNNTQLFLRNEKFKSDIEKIEKALPEYLYDFDKYELKPQLKSKTF